MRVRATVTTFLGLSSVACPGPFPPPMFGSDPTDSSSATTDGDDGTTTGSVVITQGCDFYVDATAAVGGDGTGWTRAFSRLTAALDLAETRADSVVCVAGGTYVPGDGVLDPEVTFAIPMGTSVSGGFCRTEATVEDRTTACPTRLSGDLLGDDADGEPVGLNARHVVMPGNETSLDGFVISGGRIDADVGAVELSGAGIRIDGVRDVTISSCVLESNHAGEHVGGGIGIVASTEIVLTEVTLRHNRAARGGGLSADGPGGLLPTTLELRDVVLEENTGGGMLVTGNAGVVAVGATFIANEAAASGGGLLAEGNAIVELRGATFTVNIAEASGGAIALVRDEGQPTLQGYDLHILDNIAVDDGGALYADGSAVVELHRTAFVGNEAGDRGGAIRLVDTDSATLVNVLVAGNIAGGDGGGLSMADSLVAITHATVTDNITDGAGGALRVRPSIAVPMPAFLTAGEKCGQRGEAERVAGRPADANAAAGRPKTGRQPGVAARRVLRSKTRRKAA
jgi:hypothetical protein